jgi:hypothetical protein
MEEEISVARIVNAICLDTSFKGMHLLVEGKQDYKLYKKFIDNSAVRIKTTRGKYRLREIYALLIQRGVADVVGIRDADFLRIKDNPKHSPNYPDAIYPTDFHDAEIMLVRGGILADYLTMVSTPEQVTNFEGKHGAIFDVVMQAIYPLGCLRLANKRAGLGLSFKPERPEGNLLKVRKFLQESDWKVDIPSMINTVWEYSQNRTSAVATREAMASSLDEIMSEAHSADEISNGHDFAAVLQLITTKGLKSTNKLSLDTGCVEDLLIALFDLKKFSATRLYGSVQGWSSAKSKPLVFQLP